MIPVKKCEACGERIRDAAHKCAACGREICWSCASPFRVKSFDYCRDCVAAGNEARNDSRKDR